MADHAHSSDDHLGNLGGRGKGSVNPAMLFKLEMLLCFI